MRLLLPLILTLFIFACNNADNELKVPDSPTVAIVGEEKISNDFLKAYLIANGVKEVNDEVMQQALKKLIDEVAMANIAKKKKLPLSVEQINTLIYLKTKVLAAVASENYLKKHPITEDEIKAEYDKANKIAGGKQYHVHHLLYKDEVQAIKQLEKIKSVEDFKIAEITFMQEHPNMRGVGDLGWIILGQLPPNFAKILPTLTPNSIASDVINSKFGAHIVYLEDVRDLQAPKFETVKAGIIQSLKAKRMAKFAQLARAKAHVKVKQD